MFFAVSSRDQVDYRLQADRLRRLWLRDDDPRNADDVRTYIRRYVARERMHDRIAAWSTDTERFVEVVTAKSQGNFMYIVHVLDDLRTGTLGPGSTDRLEDLPEGLRAYYERHWAAMRNQDRDRFERVYEPVLRMLASVREPVSAAKLAEYTGVPPPRIREVIRDWRQYLNEEYSTGGEARYRLYHASFQDFLAEEGVGLAPSHDRIVETALGRIPRFPGRRPR